MPMASTPGTVVGNGGDRTGGVGPATAVGASGDFWSVHADGIKAIASQKPQRSALRRHRTPDLPGSPVSATLKAHDRNPASRSRGGVCLAALPGGVAVGVCAGAVLRLARGAKRPRRRKPTRVMKRPRRPHRKKAMRARCITARSRTTAARSPNACDGPGIAAADACSRYVGMLEAPAVVVGRPSTRPPRSFRRPHRCSTGSPPPTLLRPKTSSLGFRCSAIGPCRSGFDFRRTFFGGFMFSFVRSCYSLLALRAGVAQPVARATDR